MKTDKEKIDNAIYNSKEDIWWQPNSFLHLLKTSVNPCRVGYFKKIIRQHSINPIDKTALEVGCGGGILSEELCKMGFETTGTDPSEESISIAINHAAQQNLRIQYNRGAGEKLPYPDCSFDFVFCCDVLEHVNDLQKVIAEISRVLKPGGLFFYDTINRTFLSNLITIKIAQQWKWFALMPADFHVWNFFIKPKEIIALLAKRGLLHQQHCGTSVNINPVKILFYLRRRAKGKLSYKELGEKFILTESNDMNLLYIGYAIKKQLAG